MMPHEPTPTVSPWILALIALANLAFGSIAVVAEVTFLAQVRSDLDFGQLVVLILFTVVCTFVVFGLTAILATLDHSEEIAPPPSKPSS